MDKIAVLIPCFNESQTIEKVVSDWKRELPEAVIYVYDNNSSDNTADLATKAGAVVRHEYSSEKIEVSKQGPIVVYDLPSTDHLNCDFLPFISRRIQISCPS